MSRRLNLISHEKEKCVGCNRCVKGCPIMEANVTTFADGKVNVDIDNQRCIACGLCITECHHDARTYEDDTERFFYDLRNGVGVSLIAAPAIRTNFTEWAQLLTWLRTKGAHKIYDVSLGADICTWAHIRHFQKRGVSNIITQPCPAIVNYILMHRTELIRCLSPIHSPMLCTAIFMNKYEGVKTKIAALSPCVAKSAEFGMTGYVDYNVTFEGLRRYMYENNIILPDRASGFDHYDSGLGTLYPMPGGLKENVEHYLGKAIRIDKSEGERVVYKALDEYATQPAGNLPVIFDVLNCAEGCNVGTACGEHKSIFEINTVMSDVRASVIKEEKIAYLDELFDKFDNGLRMDDFVRKYVPMPVRAKTVLQSDLDRAMQSLGKYTEEDMIFDCGACGYVSCKKMAEAIAKKVNTPSNCLKKMHQDTTEEHALLMQSMVSFEEILSETGHVRELAVRIEENIDEITEALTAYNRMVTEIEKIAMQINLISLNASIEAAKAGQFGKAFSVVAEEIRRLAQSSNNSAKSTKEASVKAGGAIESVHTMVTEISHGVKSTYDSLATVSNQTRAILEKDDART